MATKVRLTGIDLFRCFAIYGVILLHSDEGISAAPAGWKEILQFSSFAVPFFLATSFYLTFNKIYKTGGQYALKERLARLVVPYFVWTGLYIGYKVVKYSLQNELNDFSKFFQDPIALIFFGGAAFQLYFLPLLIAGTMAIKLLLFIVKNRLNTQIIIRFLLVSLIVYQILISSGNTFQISTGTAFQSWLNAPGLLNLKDAPVVRIFLTEMALIIRCLPYIFAATILNKFDVAAWLHRNNKISFAILWIFAFLAVNIFGSYLLPESICELAQGFTALIAGITLSNHLGENKIISSLSACSFGIYLIHLLVVETFQSVETRIYPGGMFRTSTPNLLIFSLLILGVSWLATDVMMRKKVLSRIMFGT